LQLSTCNLQPWAAFQLDSPALHPNPLGMEKPDQLRELWRMQDALNKRIGVVTEGMSDEDKAKWLLNYSRALTQETAELVDSVPWKWWAKYQKFDEQNARVEVVDLFHFLISMAQVLGMSADDVFHAYLKKNEVNFKRQEAGYHTKDEHDSKHI
jgi:dimeric dUTPase (all-alpha-NTP-PPase superfamily)